jgi:hypothetical protein
MERTAVEEVSKKGKKTPVKAVKPTPEVSIVGKE